MKIALAWLKIMVVAFGLIFGSAALAVDSNYISGIWAIPATKQLGDRLYNVAPQTCANTCSANAACTGFYSFTDWNTCQLYGADADIASRIGPWSNVQMNWKKPSPDPLTQYTSGIAPIPNNGALTETLYGYQPQQCAKMCNAKADCIGFHSFTDANICRLYGLDSTWSTTNGPWSNVKMYMKVTQPRILMVDAHVLTTTNGGNEGWTREFLQKLLAKATQQMNGGEVVFSLGGYDRVVDDALYNGRLQWPILQKFGNTTHQGRVTIYVSSPYPTDASGLSWQGVTFAPYSVISSRHNSFNDEDIEETAKIFLHEMAHNQGFYHNSSTDWVANPSDGGGSFLSFPYATDWYWNNSPLARQVWARLADWSKLHQKGIDQSLKANNYNCAIGAQLPNRGAFPAPNVPARTSQECAARCSQSTSCVAFYSWTDSPTCVLFDATSIGHDTEAGWLNVEMCWRK